MRSQLHEERIAPARRHSPPLSHVLAGTGRGSSHGKAILLGEHSIVYEGPAISIPLLEMGAEAVIVPADVASIASDLYTGPVDGAPDRFAPIVTAMRTARETLLPGDGPFALTLRSEIPHERGLGSSAAVAAAIVGAVESAAGVTLGDDARHELIQRAERVAHGAPSGIDARSVVASAPIRFEGGRCVPAPLGAPLTFVVADTGIRGGTRAAVGSVRELRDLSPQLVGSTIFRLADLADGAGADLREGDAGALGERMREAHGLLGRIGVSCEALDDLVAAADAAGALGAKLTGGGRGGCVLALASSRAEADALASALQRAGAVRVWTTDVSASTEAEAA